MVREFDKTSFKKWYENEMIDELITVSEREIKFSEESALIKRESLW